MCEHDLCVCVWGGDLCVSMICVCVWGGGFVCEHDLCLSMVCVCGGVICV